MLFWVSCSLCTSVEFSAKFVGRVFSAVRQRDEWERKRKMKVKRERGWTGNSWGGISLGPPDPGPNGGKRSHTQGLQGLHVSTLCIYVCNT